MAKKCTASKQKIRIVSMMQNGLRQKPIPYFESKKPLVNQNSFHDVEWIKTCFLYFVYSISSKTFIRIVSMMQNGLRLPTFLMFSQSLFSIRIVSMMQNGLRPVETKPHRAFHLKKDQNSFHDVEWIKTLFFQPYSNSFLTIRIVSMMQNGLRRTFLLA